MMFFAVFLYLVDVTYTKYSHTCPITEICSWGHGNGIFYSYIRFVRVSVSFSGKKYTTLSKD